MCQFNLCNCIGHNFGAGHQQVDGSSVGALPTSGALIVSEKFNTIMSSIGTGDENRNYKLPIFSNLTYLCGGQNCGDSQVADNASTVEAFALQNSNLRETVIPIDNIATFIRTRPDSDGDGVVDDEDAFPFLDSESADSDNDGVGDNTDQFPFDESEFIDTDSDGIGNNADTDDDNDNTADNFDALPLIATEQFDDDNDGIGNNADEVDNDFQEFRDSDNDGIGNLFDVDDDNDGVDEYFTPDSIENSNVMVVSANTHQIIEFDAQTGNEIGVAATTLPGGLTFRSDIVLSPSGQVFFIAFSDVYRLDRQDGTVKNVVDRSRLQTNFPAHLTFSDDRTLLVNNGLGNSFIEAFAFLSDETELTRQEFSEDVYRDNVIINGDELLIVNRSENTIQKLNLGVFNSNLELFADQGLDFPEQIAVDSLGRIYVTNAGNGSITTYDNSGNFTGTLVAGGQIKPTCIVVGPDQLLYVCDELGNRIVRYSLDTGALVDEFISGSTTSIDRPMGLVFVGKIADDMPFDPTNDSDQDGTANNQDAFPLDETETTDTDNDGIGNNADTDDDNDGMTDAFEEQFNFDPLNPADASQDPDNDGLTNLAEFNRGTDPLVANVIEEPSSSSGGALQAIWLALLLIIWRCRQANIAISHHTKVKG